MCTTVETTGLEQELIKDIEGERVYTPGMQELARKSAAESFVLLKFAISLSLTKNQFIQVYQTAEKSQFICKILYNCSVII